jgi:outer membrane lipoprotein-sorting protein
MRFLRTASTARLVAAIAALLTAIAAGAAIAVAATGSGPVPAPTSLAKAVHTALRAGGRDPVTSISANITFTDNLIDSSDFTGQAGDPLLQGASGRMWWSEDGGIRVELQSDNGDVQIVVDHRSWWISDPAENVVYEGTLPAESSGATGASGSDGSGRAVPTVAEIESKLSTLMQSVNLSGAQPTDVAGRPAYRVTISPKGAGGLVGSLALAWDALRGVPLTFAVYARGDAAPVLALTATHISYGPVAASVFAITPPAGAHIIELGSAHGTVNTPAGADRHLPVVTGVRAVGSQLAFPLHPPAQIQGLTLRSTRLIDLGGVPGALVLYGHGLGTIAVIETRGVAADTAHGSVGGLSLPTRSIDGVTATVLATPLGTVLRFTRDGVGYTVLGSVSAASAETAAGALAAGTLAAGG